MGTSEGRCKAKRVKCTQGGVIQMLQKVSSNPKSEKAKKSERVKGRRRRERPETVQAVGLRVSRFLLTRGRGNNAIERS